MHLRTRSGRPHEPPVAHTRKFSVARRETTGERSGAPIDRGMLRCRICERPLPPWPGRGRPRIYCEKGCRDEARYLRELESAVAFWKERGYADRELHVRRVIARRLASARASSGDMARRPFPS